MSDELIPSSGAPAAAPPSASPVAATPATYAPSTPTPPVDDRANWIPPDAFKQRMNETRASTLRQAQQEYAQRESQIRAEAENYRRQVLALTGVQAPPNPEIAAVRDQFGNLYPGLAKLEAAADRLLELQERSGDHDSQIKHYWDSFGRQTMDRLYDHASQSMGVPLSPSAKQQLHTAFLGFISTSPEMANRYANDPSIVEDFWKDFNSSFIDPIRRSASAGIQARVPGALPQDSPGGAPRSSPAPKFDSLDDRVNAGWALYNK